MDESHDNSLNESKLSGKDESRECKFCKKKFDSLQLVLKHELLSHTLNKALRKSPAYQLKRKVTAALKTINSEDEKKARQELVEAISDCAEGVELDVIFKKYQINNENLMCIYSRVHTCLEDELNKIGEFSIKPFGSITNGLALKRSDIDLHVSNKVHHINSNIVFRDVTSMLYKSNCFTNILPIRQAKVPIIKCVHKATGFSLDINTSEPYGVYNSKFIRQLNESDQRIHRLMLFLKIWCKNMHINGTFNMTNYCLIALIIFFLQNSNPPVVDSIKILQRNAPKRYIKGVNFEVNLRSIPLDSSQSTHELIKGFFHFYQSFNFEDYIIAPYLGKIIKREDFNNKTFIYPEYETQLLSFSQDGEVERLRTDRPVCIQDAFCLNVNVGKCLTETNVQYFKKCVNLAYQKCSEALISKKNLYKYLLVNLIDDVTNIDLEVEIDLPKNDLSMSFDIIPRKNELKSLSKFESDPLLIRKLWVKEYIDAIVQIVTEVYRIDMTLLSSTQGIKFKKIDENDECAEPLPTKWCITCYVDLWSGRQIQRTNVTPFMDYHLEQTKKLNAERRQDSNFAVQLKGYLNLSIINNYSALRVEVSSGGDTICKKDKLRKFFNALKCIMQNYNLKQRIYQLETQAN